MRCSRAPHRLRRHPSGGATRRRWTRLGLHYAKAAGYDPGAALTLIDTLQTRAPSGSVKQFLDIHPPIPSAAA
jgi:hypothetical protein